MSKENQKVEVQPMNVTHSEFTSGEKVTLSQSDIEHREQMREALKSMNFGRIFGYIDDKEAKDYSFLDKDGKEISGTSHILKVEMPILGLIELKDKNLFSKVEKGKSYLFDYRLENKKNSTGSTYVSYNFIDVHHLPQFDKKYSSAELLGSLSF